MVCRMLSVFFNFRKRMKTFSVVCALLLGFFLPLHHHADGSIHTACIACVAQNQPTEVAAVFCFAIFSARILAAACYGVFPYSRVIRAVYHTRAPPAFI